MYFDIHTDRRRKTPYHYGLFRESYRDEDGQVRHRTRGKVMGLPLEKLKALREFVRAGMPDVSGVEKSTRSSREYGASGALWELALELGLDKMLYSRREEWVRYILAMIIGRVVWQGSKLSLVNLWKDTCLWDLMGLGGPRPDVDACYTAMDELLFRQGAIEKKLAKGRLTDGCVVLYDITRAYMEGDYDGSGLVDFGYAPAGKRGHKQVLVGLLTDREGCPVGVRVYRGNTSDQKTVSGWIETLKGDYELSQVIFVGDRGMLTKSRLTEVGQAGLQTVTALRHGQIMTLLKRGVIQMGLFDEKNIAQVVDPDPPNVRYMLCKNPLTAKKETKTRRALLDKTTAALVKLQSSKGKFDDQKRAAKVGAVLGKWKMAKFFTWRIQAGRLTWNLDQDRIQQEEILDGCYVVRTDVSKERLDKDEAVACYRRLMRVEQAFRNLKTVLLEIRPMFHHKDERIESHVLICMLAYWLQWHMLERLAPLFERDGEGSDRRWTLDGVIERLKGIRQEIVRFDGVDCLQTTTPDEEQQHILDLLKVNL